MLLDYQEKKRDGITFIIFAFSQKTIALENFKVFKYFIQRHCKLQEINLLWLHGIGSQPSYTDP
jgi:hypothetical protein